MGRMVRTQVQLTEDQLQALRKRAAQQGVSMAELVRRGVNALLEQDREPAREEVRRRAMLAAGALHGGPPDLAARHDDYLGEVFGE